MEKEFVEPVAQSAPLKKEADKELNDATENFLRAVMMRRVRGGLHVQVTGIPDRDIPFDFYAKDEGDRDRFIQKQGALGRTVKIIQEPHR